MKNLVNLYLLSPLHTGGVSQAGNEVGIARETHTNFPYIPSSTIRGRLRAQIMINVEANTDPENQKALSGLQATPLIVFFY